MVEVFVLSAIVLVAGSFSFWYSSKLSLFKRPSFKYSFLVTLFAYVGIGATRALLKFAAPDFKGIAAFGLSVLVGLIIQVFIAKLTFNESWIRTIITVFFAALVTVIIVIPLVVSAGFLTAYMNPPQPNN
ncbi:MAG TPA: hypothetical protein DEP48_09745 [Persephonella sp.]|uniref:Uncharacterized protein n=1 Tax=Persephonella marina (strain DSM 14350 / EX-H1) TaxID=123214 RepID=C0QST6_PERMH|nr:MULTISPECIES: hypothetical protein [Persephonella]ACO03171.1 hypothetical protein PERMA_1979 [Persephonella marina EX-H1]HCB70629.1 hypothetical protein [Persephonella sp.]